MSRTIWIASIWFAVNAANKSEENPYEHSMNPIILNAFAATTVVEGWTRKKTLWTTMEIPGVFHVTDLALLSHHHFLPKTFCFVTSVDKKLLIDTWMLVTSLCILAVSRVLGVARHWELSSTKAKTVSIVRVASRQRLSALIVANQSPANMPKLSTKSTICTVWSVRNVVLLLGTTFMKSTVFQFVITVYEENSYMIIVIVDDFITKWNTIGRKKSRSDFYIFFFQLSGWS